MFGKFFAVTGRGNTIVINDTLDHFPRDNDTNIMIRISVFIGLLIELWKIKKVINIELVREEKLFGILPMIRFSDKGSYVVSSTRQYDQVSFLFNYSAGFYFKILPF